MAKRSGKGKLVLILLLMVVAGLWYVNSDNKPASKTGPQSLYSLEKTGSGFIADYTATSRKVHDAVDTGLSGAKLTAQNVQETRREVPRQKAEGTIRWNARQLQVSLSADGTPEGVQQALAASLKNTGGEVLATQADTYQGMSATRIDVGVKDSLEGDSLTLITDRIYITGDKKSDSQTAAPAGPGRGQMAIIVDDFGYSSDVIASYAAIQRPMTWAIIPYRPYSNEAATRGLSSGHQVILHLPMEPISGAEQSESITVTTGMSDQEIQQTVAKAIQSVPGLIGVNNHQGSKATADRRVMKDVLTVLKANNLFFVDSRTNSQSVAYETSRQMGLRTGENELFLDNSSDIESIKSRIRTAIQLALHQGSVTVIGHARPHTVVAIREMIPEIEAAGVRLVFESQLVR